MDVLRRLAREPLLHFLLIGVLVFAAYQALDDAPPAASAEEIVVSPEQAIRLAEQFQAVWRRPPTTDELDGLIDEHIREEVYVREALALGLDRNDAVIRQRLRQKMQFLTESATTALEPADTELRAHYDAFLERFTALPRIAFRQVYLGETPDDDAVAATLVELAVGVDPATLGQRTLLPPGMNPAAPATVDGTFGPGFFDRVASVEPGVWTGPVTSGFGAHLVRLDNVELATLPPFEAVREKVLLDWQGARMAEMGEAAYDRMRSAYAVTRPDPASLGELLP